MTSDTSVSHAQRYGAKTNTGFPRNGGGKKETFVAFPLKHRIFSLLV